MKKQTMDDALRSAVDDATDGLVDVQRTKADKKADEKAIKADFPSEPDYPYGLRITLNDEVLKKLKADLPNVGDSFDIDAIGVVKSVSSNQSTAGRDRRSVDIQIQRIALEKRKGKK